jgi:hypothetical protein
MKLREHHDGSRSSRDAEMNRCLDVGAMGGGGELLFDN